jgi:xanthine phosphoribosyltransferase
MDKLKETILREGIALSNDVLLVDSFLNHQVDIPLMREIGQTFAEMFADIGATRVVTIESSGIAPAMMTADAMGLPLLIMKKQTSSILSEDLIQLPVVSYTKGGAYMLTVKRKFIEKDDRVLFIDDFLANGEAALGAAKLIETAGAQVAGVGIVIEKAFQLGKKRLQDFGYVVRSLATVAYMSEGVIEFEHAQ